LKRSRRGSLSLTTRASVWSAFEWRLKRQIVAFAQQLRCNSSESRFRLEGAAIAP
jgi:hypothetical protein